MVERLLEGGRMGTNCDQEVGREKRDLQVFQISDQGARKPEYL